MAEPGKGPRPVISVVASQKEQGKEKETGRVSSGIADLDELIEGGFPVGKSYLIAGEAGSGKSIFCMRFILNSLMDGEKVVYVPLDEKPTEAAENAVSLGWDLRRYVSGGQLLMLDAAPSLNASSGAGGREVDVGKVVADLASYVSRSGATRLVIDPVEPLIAPRDLTKGYKQQARLLIRSLQDQMAGTTILLTLNTSARGGEGSRWDDYPVDGVILLGFRREQNSLVRTLLVGKMRGTAIDLVERRFSIVKDQGIAISEAAVEPADRMPSQAPAPLPADTSQPSETAEAGQSEQIFFKEWQG